MNSSKNIFESKTYHGLFVAMLGILAQKFGWADFIDSHDIETIVLLAMQLGGLLWAAYGRWKAQKALRVLLAILSFQVAFQVSEVDAGEEPLAAPVTLPVVDTFSFTDAVSVSTFVFYDSSSEDFGAGVRFSYDINDHVKLRTDYQTSNFTFDGGEVGSDVSLTLQFEYPLKTPTPYGIVPYVVTGTGIQSFDDPSIDAIIGAGFEFDLMKDVAGFLEYEFGSKESNNTVRLGISLSF